MKKVLFVCLGNICRSPSAEGVFKHFVKKEGLEEKIKVDSCGTLDHHQGEAPDLRSQKHAEDRGYKLDSLARGLRKEDLDGFDYIITMDDSNYKNVTALSSPKNNNKIKRMTDYCKKFEQTQVPDPYYGGPDGFELVLDLLEDACSHLLDEVKSDLQS